MADYLITRNIMQANSDEQAAMGYVQHSVGGTYTDAVNFLIQLLITTGGSNAQYGFDQEAVNFCQAIAVNPLAGRWIVDGLSWSIRERGANPRKK